MDGSVQSNIQNALIGGRFGYWEEEKIYVTTRTGSSIPP